MPKKLNLTNQQFGRLTAVKPTSRRNGGCVVWKCRCACGNTYYARASDLQSGKTQSCGCLQRDKTLHRKGLVENTDLDRLNTQVAKNNTSHIKGVSWDRNTQKWLAHITFKGVQRHLGRFNSLKDAAIARRKAEQNLFDPILAAYDRPLTNDYVS